jgi:(2S)-methylsuccinyl-CoA dehydrogenase
MIGASIAPVSEHVLDEATVAVAAADRFVVRVRDRVADLLSAQQEGRSREDPQSEFHGYAWMAAYVSVLGSLLRWARRREDAGAFGEIERLLFQIGMAEYLTQLGSGIAMSQDETARPGAYDLDDEAAAFLADPSVSALRRRGQGTGPRTRLIQLVLESGASGIGRLTDEDETVAMVRAQFRSFTDERIAPFASEWHAKDALIPLDTLKELADLGVFGLTTPEEHGGSGMGAGVMCVVTEELARGYLGAGSLGTRAEIASELIRLGGTADQKHRYLPRVASGEILPTAVFTEPNTGSDLANIKTRAVREGDIYRIFGNKTWITHGARSDLMVLLARTGPVEDGHRGLTMFLAEKPRGSEEEPFPAAGMAGGEIRALGYRGMREYEIAFDGFAVPATQVLGGEEGQGFKQLMTTFELARIQTAARAIGVAQNALELAFDYAKDRVQFGKSIISFPRVANKLAWMVVELAMARVFLSEVAHRKETGVRCDVEAGMAKLLGARIAWSAADNALQIHGGNGYSLEYSISRVLCDARILNIFEGAAEIQAQVIARGLISQRRNQ